VIILRLRGLRGAELSAAVDEVASGYGLASHLDKKVCMGNGSFRLVIAIPHYPHPPSPIPHPPFQARALSGGTQRKLSAAMALSCGSPKIVFVDEPTTGVNWNWHWHWNSNSVAPGPSSHWLGVRSPAYRLNLPFPFPFQFQFHRRRCRDAPLHLGPHQRGVT